MMSMFDMDPHQIKKFINESCQLTLSVCVAMNVCVF